MELLSAVKIALKKINLKNIQNTLVLYADTPLIEEKLLKVQLIFLIKIS